MPRIQALKKDYMVRDFAHFVKDHIRDEGMKQEDLADILGISQQKLSYKICHNTFSYAEFLAIVEVFKPNDNELMRLVKSW